MLRTLTLILLVLLCNTAQAKEYRIRSGWWYPDGSFCYQKTEIGPNGPTQGTWVCDPPEGAPARPAVTFVPANTLHSNAPAECRIPSNTPKEDVLRRCR